MFSRHVERSLPRYCDGDLSVAEQQRVGAHLAVCARCRSALEEVQFSAKLLEHLSTVSAPPSVWNGIESALSAPSARPSVAHGLRWAFAGVVALALAGTVYWSTRVTTSKPWEVAHAREASTRRMAAGEWVDTAGGSTARIIVGQLGTVDVAPQTRVRLGRVSQSEYRLALARGTISAEINAPPRLFIVDTPASTIVDLGCAYTVTVGDDGDGVLRMTTGWASLEWKARESLVPAGAMCRLKRGTGPGTPFIDLSRPGTPYFEDASSALKQAVDDFDEGKDPSRALDVIIREARVRDTLTLWHLLSLVDEQTDRARVYDAIARFEPPPDRVSRDQILALDPNALRRWREELAWKW
ncbi:MAG TPA: zf-HC2 domain-containing protein [Vicinamibacterales bacterium]|jgi:predicted anti-sigma-YlaC factor YlaD